MAPTKIRNMEEFAAVSGISRPTVSKYLNDPDRVRPPTRARIEEALEAHDDRPNIDAMNQNRRLTKNIGSVVPYLADPFFAEIARVIENLSLFQQGKCGMWIDATVAASFVTNLEESTVADHVGFALAPGNGLGKRSNWLWAWALGIPAGSQKEDAAKAFIEWATEKVYIELVASKGGWANVSPGARTSLYEKPEYQKVPFAQMTLGSILSADPNNSTVEPSPYAGVQFAAKPEFAGIATEVSQAFSAVYAGQQTVDEALRKAQAITNDAMEAAGYR